MKKFKVYNAAHTSDAIYIGGKDLKDAVLLNLSSLMYDWRAKGNSSKNPIFPFSYPMEVSVYYSNGIIGGKGGVVVELTYKYSSKTDFSEIETVNNQIWVYASKDDLPEQFNFMYDEEYALKMKDMIAEQKKLDQEHIKRDFEIRKMNNELTDQEKENERDEMMGAVIAILDAIHLDINSRQRLTRTPKTAIATYAERYQKAFPQNYKKLENELKKAIEQIPEEYMNNKPLGTFYIFGESKKRSELINMGF